MKELEIEYKALMTKELFEEVHSNSDIAEQFSQVNHYFDTKDEVLKNNNMAIRIRKKENSIKLTLKHKIQGDNSSYTEVTDFINESEMKSIIDDRVIKSDIINGYLEENSIKLTELVNYNIFTTNRSICYNEDHVLFLDETTYANGTTDYELEIEAKTIELCEDSFNRYLNKYNLKRSMVHKIERAINNK